MALNLSRNSRLFISTVTAGFDSTNTWEVQMQDGFSFSQGIDSTEITVSEAGATPTRGAETFNSALQPADWAFTSYMRSYVDAGAATIQTTEAILWHALATNATPDFGLAGVPNARGQLDRFHVDFEDSDHHELAKIHLLFNVDNVWYRISDCQVNQADIDFSIDGIAMVAWSGQGTVLRDITDTPSAYPDIITPEIVAGTDPTVVAVGARGVASTDGGTGNTTATEYLAVPSSATYIKNKLSTLSLVGARVGQNDNTIAYAIAITGGNLSITNNITYITPETLSIVDTPIGSFSGARSMTGQLTCYLDTKDNGSSTLIRNLSNNLSTKNSYSMVLNLGGPSGPRVVFALPYAQLAVPVIEVADVLGLNIDFAAQGANGIEAAADMSEITIEYFNA
jgi:hypothetical protein